MKKYSFLTREMNGNARTKAFFTINTSPINNRGGGSFRDVNGAQDSPVSPVNLPALPAGKAWSEERYIWVRVSNTQSTAQVFYIGDAAGTNNITNGTLTWDGDFGSNTNTVIKNMTAENKFFLTTVKMQADSQATLNAVKLKFVVADQNSSGSYFSFPNTVIPKRTDTDFTIANWVMVNKWFRAESALTASLPIGNVTTAVLDITLGYRKMLP